MPTADAEPGLGLGVALVGGGDPGVLLDVLPDAGAVGEAEADVDEPEGDGDGDVVGLEVDGCGVGVLAVGSTSHLVAVPALALADVVSRSARPRWPSPCPPVRRPASPRARRGSGSPRLAGSVPRLVRAPDA